VLSRTPLPLPDPRFSLRLLSRVLLLLPLVVFGTVLHPEVGNATDLALTWIDNSGGMAGFSVERKTGTDGTYAQTAQQLPGITSYTDLTVIPGTIYCYRVQAYDASGTSGYSNEACGAGAGTLDLTVSLTGTGAGSVSSSPAGITCGTDCFESYPSGTLVTLSGAATAGSTFGGWSGGGCSGTTPCTVTGNTPLTVAAAFTQAPPTLDTVTVTKSGAGTVTSSPAGITCGADCSESYTSGTVVTLTATPASNASFSGWSGGGCSGTGTCTVTLLANTSVSAKFVKGRKK